MAVAQQDGEVVFLHRVAPGAAEESYGVQVARMAGLPAVVVERATALMAERAPVPVPHEPHDESHDESHDEPGALHERRTAYQQRGAGGAEVSGRLALALAGINIAAMTPIEALNVLFSLQQHALAALYGERA
jgi:DNA mismatch repair protein MutS